MQFQHLRNMLSGLVAFMLLVSMAFAQGTVTGTVNGGSEGEALVGASVIVKGKSIGTFTDFNGAFKLKAPAGNQTLVISYIGYVTKEVSVEITDGSTTNLGTVSLESDAIGVDEVEILASVAVDRKTPVAVSTVNTDDIEAKLSSQEFPEILKATPSVYVTKQGGGWGDARINVRGFDQRNTAVLINGIPVNDMENGWVYWSNWAGLSDVTRTVQVQRGLGASKLAINSVGGTINLITKTTDMKAGGNANFTVGNDGYMKGALTLSTGRLNSGTAITFSGSRTMGDGYVDAAYIDGWSYFLSVAQELGKDHQLVLTGFGAPQKHGQRSFAENLAKYADTSLAPGWTPGDSYHDLVKSSTTSDFDNRMDAPNGDGMYSPIGNIRYNSDYGFRNGEFYHIRENFYHKPQVALNHYWNISDRSSLVSSAYYSIGRGGGTGDRGSIGGRGTWGWRDDNGIIRVDDIFSWNQGNTPSGFPDSDKIMHGDNGYVATESYGLIKRASMNEHNWMGILSTFTTDLNENFKLMIGADVRRYVGLHYRKLVDGMGNDLWLESRDANGQSVSLDVDQDGEIGRRESGKLVDEGGEYWGNPGQEGKLNYDNDGIVGWQGLFTQLEYSKDGLSLFLAASGSNKSYKRIDRFNYLAGSENETTDGYSFLGGNFKLGGNYNINDNHNVYANLGYYANQPIFDVVFPNFNNVDINADAPNEKVLGFELGYGLRSKDLAGNINLYRTQWDDKSFFQRAQTAGGVDFFANIQGVSAVHQGVEVDVIYKPSAIRGLKITGMVSMGDWQWANDVEALISDDNNVVIDTVNIFLDGVKVGDAAQTTAAFGVEYGKTFAEMHTVRANVQVSHFSNNFADFDPVSRTDAPAAGASNVQAYKLPGYTLLDLGASYQVDFDGFGLKLYGNVNNVLDQLYVAEANDRTGATDLSALSGFFGFGRTWTAGLKVMF